MSEPIFERYMDERGNISVRVSHDVTVLTQEEAERAMAKYDQLRTENQRLRELVRYIMHQCNDGNPRCDECIGWNDGECVALQRMRELEVDA